MYSTLSSFTDQLISLSSGDGSLLVARDLSRHIEDTLRALYARDQNRELLTDPTIGLIDLFAAPLSLRMICARPAISPHPSDASDQYIFSLPQHARRTNGELATAATISVFLNNWDIFTEGVFSNSFDWSNVIAAGGSVAACITPLPAEVEGDATKMKDYFRDGDFATSDIDLFLWGLTISEVSGIRSSISPD